jgi:hypothetical protein
MLLFFLSLVLALGQPTITLAGTIRFMSGRERQIDNCEDAGTSVRYLMNATWYVAKKTDVLAVAPACAGLPLLTRQTVTPTQSTSPSSPPQDSLNGATSAERQLSTQSSPGNHVNVQDDSRKDGTDVRTRPRRTPGGGKRQ